MRADPDERIVALVRAGDRNAFEELYDRYTPGLLSYCRHLLGTLDEAEDAVQHTFLAAHRALLADDRTIHLKAWLYAIARNRCLSMLRARRERVGFDEELEALPSTAGLAAEVEQREDLRAMLGDLQKLPEDQRSALVLSELGAHTHDEIAEVLDVKRQKVKALVFQAREALAAARTARETPCLEIREELATARGGALRRGNLRRHLEACAGCRAFRDDVAHQRAAFSLLLPVAPSLALKQAVLGGAAVTAGGGAAAAGGSIAAGGAAAGGKAATAKLLTVIVAAGGAGGGGAVAVHETHKSHGPPPASADRAAVPHHHYADDVSAQSTPLPPRAATPPTPPAGAVVRPAARRVKPNRRARTIFASARTRRKKHHKHANADTAPPAQVIFASDTAPAEPQKGDRPAQLEKPAKPKKPKKPKHEKHAKADKPKHAPPPPEQQQPASAPPPEEHQASRPVLTLPVASQKDGKRKGHFKGLHKDGPGKRKGHVEFPGTKPAPAPPPQPPAKKADDKDKAKLNLPVVLPGKKPCKDGGAGD